MDKVTKEYNESYQLGTLAGVFLSKCVKGFRLKPYKGQMLENPFKEDENPQNMENRSEVGTTSKATDPVEPGTAGK